MRHTKLSLVQNDEPTIPQLHSDLAEEILRKEGKSYALAYAAGNSDDQHSARDNLKLAIARALATEFAYGASAQQRDGNRVCIRGVST